MMVEILVMMVIMPWCNSEDKSLFSQEILFRDTKLILIISALIFNLKMIQNWVLILISLQQQKSSLMSPCFNEYMERWL